MILPAYVQVMARYNRWQNTSIYTAAATLSDQQRKESRGAFFGSLQGTLNHLLWGDQMWMSRFAGTPKPRAANVAASVEMFGNWDDLARERAAFDEVIVSWADKLDPEWLKGDLTWYSGASQREMTQPKAQLVAHFFNHQTHHRGQAHCLLTQFDAKPEATDLPWMPDAAL
jgi:uncharacterized damage-inducible protein DinB